jgi:Ca2+-binding EF-hand superfamily protein
MGEELSEEDIADMIRRADADQDGVVSREEFFELISGQRRE